MNRRATERRSSMLPDRAENVVAPRPQHGSGLLFALGALLLVLAGAVALWALLSFQAVSNRLEDQRQARLELERLSNTLTEAQVGERGFLLTGEDSYLRPFAEGRLEVEEHFDALEALSLRDALDGEDLAALRDLAEEVVAEQQEAIDEARRTGDGPAVLRGQRRAIDTRAAAIREKLDALSASLSRRIDAAHKTQQKRERNALLALVGLALLALGLFAAGARRLHREVTLRRQSEEALQAERDSLERRVMDRTAELRETMRERDADRVRLAAVMEAAQLGVWEVDLDAHTVFGDERSHAIFGVPAGDRLDVESALALIHPDDRERFNAALRKAQAAGADGRFIVEYRIDNFDPPRWVASRGQVLLHEGAGEARARAFIGTIMDISQRKAAESALRESQERLRASLMASGTGTFRWDIPTGDLYFDEALDQLFGVRPSDSPRTLDDFLALVHPDDREAVAAGCAQSADGGADFSLEYRVILPGGEVRRLDDRGRVFRDADGKPAYMTGACVDVTDRVRAEDALRRSEAELRFMMEAMPQMVWLADADGGVHYFNSRWYEYTGVEAGSTDGENWASVLHPDDLERTLSLWQHAVETGEPYEIHYRFRRGSDGAYRWQLGRGLPRRDDGGQVAQWIGTCTDIHDQVVAQQQLQSREADLARLNRTLEERVEDRTRDLRDANERLLTAQKSVAEREAVLRSFYESAPMLMGIVEVEEDDVRHLLDNPATGEFFGADPAAMAGKRTLADLGSSPEVLAVWLAAYKEAAETRQPVRFEYCHPGAEERWLSVAVNFIASLEGDAFHACYVGMDVTSRRKTDEALRASKNRLEETNRELQTRNRELQEFAFVASHDLQEPLRKVTTFAGLLAEEYGDKLDGSAKMYMDRMQDAARRMSNLITDLLAFSRVMTRGKPFKQVHLRSVLDGVLQDLEVAIERTGGRIEVGMLCTVEADPLQMRQLLQNLIGNALKFHHPDVPPVVQVSASMGGSDGETSEQICTLTVRDNGIGFDAKYAERIFTPFQRLHGKSRYEGTGIGLAIVRRIVERHRGSISATSEPGSGSVFTVLLPQLRKAEEEDAAGGAMPTPQPSGQNE